MINCHTPYHHHHHHHPQVHPHQSQINLHIYNNHPEVRSIESSYKFDANQVPDSLISKQQFYEEYNSGLTKYLYKYRKSLQPDKEPYITIRQPTYNKQLYPSIPSIIQQRGLKPILVHKKPNKQDAQTMTEKTPKKLKLQNKNTMTDPIQVLTKKQKQITVNKQVQKTINPKIKPKIQQSRYLPNTALKKHFNKQVFENYGRGNQIEKGQQISSLKTFNVKPQSNKNIKNPIYQEPQQKNMQKQKMNRGCNGSKHDHDCKCCLDKIKNKILQQAKEDPQLANRILTSAKKSTLYKNYSLDCQIQGPMNPHNYRQCCGQLNII